MPGILVEAFSSQPKSKAPVQVQHAKPEHDHEQKEGKSQLNLMLFKAMNPNHML
jgi:hypothetical protein